MESKRVKTARSVIKEKDSPPIVLEGDRVEGYLNMLIRLVEGGRINKFYPDPARIRSLLHFFVPKNNYGIYEKLLINRETGFPVEKEITRVVADRELAPKTLNTENLADLEARYRENPSPVNERRLNLFKYHRDLLRVDVPGLHNMEIKLRTLDTDKYIAYFNVILDRFDVSTGLFIRYTMVVGQEDPQWSSSQVQVEGDQLKYTRGFRNLISRYTADEAEFAFVLLNDLEHVVVEEVQRCRLGPLYFNGVNIPEGMEVIFEKHPQAFILSLPADRASIYIKEDRNDDPLARMYRESLQQEARELRDRKAESIGYHVYKERKFACSKTVLSDFRKFLKSRGARCVVYGV